MRAYQIEQIHQAEEPDLQRHKHEQETIVDPYQHLVAQAPLAERRADLHGFVHVSGNDGEVAQKQKIKADPEQDPEQRSHSVRESGQVVGVSAQGKVQSKQETKVGPKAISRGKIKVVVPGPADIAFGVIS